MKSVSEDEDIDHNRQVTSQTPSNKMKDGKDYVPTKGYYWGIRPQINPEFDKTATITTLPRSDSYSPSATQAEKTMEIKKPIRIIIRGEIIGNRD